LLVLLIAAVKFVFLFSFKAVATVYYNNEKESKGRRRRRRILLLYIL
jgi:hypothetical protein